jgi:hypothetical protein
MSILRVFSRSSVSLSVKVLNFSRAMHFGLGPVKAVEDFFFFF